MNINKIIKKNKKGFTLIELLGCIVILSLLLVIVYPSLRGSGDDANNKSEEIFMNRLENSIESYIAFVASSIEWTDTLKTYKKSNDDDFVSVPIYRSTNQYNLDDVVKNGIISKPIINPGNKNKYCNEYDNKFTIYKDSDYVYCFYMKMLDNDCITGTNKIINTCSKEMTEALGLGE